MSNPVHSVRRKGRKRKFQDKDSGVLDVDEVPEDRDRSEVGPNNRTGGLSEAVQWTSNRTSTQTRILPWLVPQKSIQRRARTNTNKKVMPEESESTEINPNIFNACRGMDSNDNTVRPPLKSLENFHLSSQESNEVEFGIKADWTAKDFFSLKEIGKGGFSTVFEASCRHYEGQKVALKQVNHEILRRLSQNENQCAFLQEYNLHRALKHENIVKAIGFYRSLIVQNAVMVLEYCGKGDLQDYLSDRRFPISSER